MDRLFGLPTGIIGWRRTCVIPIAIITIILNESHRILHSIFYCSSAWRGWDCRWPRSGGFGNGVAAYFRWTEERILSSPLIQETESTDFTRFCGSRTKVTIHHCTGIIVIHLLLRLVRQPDVPAPKDSAGSILRSYHSITLAEIIGSWEQNVTVWIRHFLDQISYWRSHICTETFPEYFYRSYITHRLGTVTLHSSKPVCSCLGNDIWIGGLSVCIEVNRFAGRWPLRNTECDLRHIKNSWTAYWIALLGLTHIRISVLRMDRHGEAFLEVCRRKGDDELCRCILIKTDSVTAVEGHGAIGGTEAIQLWCRAVPVCLQHGIAAKRLIGIALNRYALHSRISLDAEPQRSGCIAELELVVLHSGGYSHHHEGIVREWTLLIHLDPRIINILYLICIGILLSEHSVGTLKVFHIWIYCDIVRNLIAWLEAPATHGSNFLERSGCLAGRCIRHLEFISYTTSLKHRNQVILRPYDGIALIQRSPGLTGKRLYLCRKTRLHRNILFLHLTGSHKQEKRCWY